ncbi:MAG: hypothetical protein J2P50_20055, partial [Hyphomicrobiaceae bacterium]|nr:hypothetical protein [Hyphomicrobiaceae bacterium]
LPDDLDLAALADPQATTAVYMPLATLPELAARLLAAGVEPDRPVCAVFKATRPDERHIAGTLATIAGLLGSEAPAGPCLLIVGWVLRTRLPTNALSHDPDTCGAAAKPCKAERASHCRPH